MQYVGSSGVRRIALDSSCLCRDAHKKCTSQVMFTLKRQNFPGAAIFPRRYGRSVKLERPDILGNFVAATIFPGDDISCDNGFKVESFKKTEKHEVDVTSWRSPYISVSR